MRYFYMTITVLLALLSIAAGLAKTFKMPQEVAFFEQSGLDTNLLVAFGVVQILGGVLTVLPKFRKFGLATIAIMFALSAAQILGIGNIVFGLISLIPAALALAMLIRHSPEN